MLGRRLAGHVAPAVVLTSPERRACETAELAFPSVVPLLRHRLSEVTKPWYDSPDDHAHAVARYLRGDAMEGWDRREDVIARMSELVDAENVEHLVLVSHGLLLTTWIDHVARLEDPLSFWSQLAMPDAWVLNLKDTSVQRIP